MGFKVVKSLVCFLAAAVIAASLSVSLAGTWEAFSQPDFRWLQQDSGTTVHLESVSCVDGNDVWALGSSSSVKNQILHYDGSGWSNFPSGTSEYLYDIFALNAGNVWTVGEYTPSGGSIYYYNGTSWMLQGSFFSGLPLAVSACSPTCAWTVGDEGLMAHYDGVGWSGQASGTTERLNDVSALDSSNAWAVGDEGTILHYDGTKWAAQSSGTTETLTGVSALDAGSVWAVGGGGTILHYDGTKWTAQSSGTDAMFEGVAAADAGNVWAVGEGGVILHYDGTGWAAQYSGTDAWLFDVDAADAGNVWAVGEGGTILHGSPGGGPDNSTWYLAEGSTDWDFETYISIVNPNEEEVEVELTYMTSSGPVAGPTVEMPPMSQAMVFPSHTLGQADFSTKVECRGGKPIGVDRTMYWWGAGERFLEAHCATGVTSPETTWFLPEGSSDWGFECFLLIQNPNATPADCTVTWMIEGAEPQQSKVTVPAASRSTMNMADHIGPADSSIMVTSSVPVIPERAMYRNDRREGHDSTGTPTAASDYYLAEGCTGFGFTTYVLVQNPNDTEAQVAVTYQATAGQVAGPTFTMPANSRKTINVNDTTAIPGPDPSFSTHVHGSLPIIAERAMYWNGGEDNAEVCHDSIGLSAPHRTWYLADGRTTDGDFETWTLVQNPNPEDISVRITYMTPDGTGNVFRDEIIPANSRRSFDMASHSGISGRAAIMVECTTSGKKIMVERAIYWFGKGVGTDTVGGYSD